LADYEHSTIRAQAAGTAAPMWRGWLWAAGLVLMSLAAIVADALSTWNTQAHSNVLRMQLGAALSAKALRLSASGFAARFGAGRLLNGFSSDARRVAEFNMLLEFLWTAPLATVAAYTMIATEIGPIEALAGIAVYILALPLVVRFSGSRGFEGLGSPVPGTLVRRPQGLEGVGPSTRVSTPVSTWQRARLLAAR
jgi:ABC-type multidrug transport system fused ATPase/permease subunit